MHRMRIDSPAAFLGAAVLVLCSAAACSSPEPVPPAATSDAIVFEGARVLVGDGGVIENATFVVDDDRLVSIGSGSEVAVPAGATRVDLSGRTVMPAIIDTHVHLREARDELVEDLQRKAYYGVGAVLSLGRGVSDVAFELRDEGVPNAARYRTSAAVSRRRSQAAPRSLTGSRRRRKPGRRCRSWRRRTSTWSRSGSTTATASSRS